MVADLNQGGGANVEILSFEPQNIVIHLYFLYTRSSLNARICVLCTHSYSLNKKRNASSSEADLFQHAKKHCF